MTDFPTIPLPSSIDSWKDLVPQMRATLWKLLGDLPQMFTPDVTILDQRKQDGFTCQKIRFNNGVGAAIYGYLLLPDGVNSAAPAILYHHAHGNKYHIGKEELFQNWLTSEEPGTALARAGFVVLAIDAYGFGERWHDGPLGAAEFGATLEATLFKKFLWEGNTLWGMMLRDDLLALNYLVSRPEVDPQRVGATGMSLGASRTTWLAALDDRLKVIVPVAQLTRYRDFAASGQYNLHGIYYYLPAMLKSGLDMEHLVSLAAPRHQCILIGDSDPLSPLVGVQAVANYTRAIYRLHQSEDSLKIKIYPSTAHKYTPDMFTAMLDFFHQNL